MKIVNIDGENFHIFWTTWGILINFSGNTWLMIILKVNLFLEDIFLETPQGAQFDAPSPPGI